MDFTVTRRSLDIDEVSAINTILFLDISHMLLNVYIAVLGMEYGALMEAERRVVLHVSFESIFIIFSPLSAIVPRERRVRACTSFQAFLSSVVPHTIGIGSDSYSLILTLRFLPSNSYPLIFTL